MAYNILIVDDSKPMRAVIKKVVRASGIDLGRLHEAGSGREALDVLEHEWLDLVLTDYNMPDMNGLELLEAMKQNELFSGIPVIMVTTERSEARVETFKRTGVSAYIQKPFTPEQIRMQILTLLGGNLDGHRGDDPGDEGLDF